MKLNERANSQNSKSPLGNNHNLTNKRMKFIEVLVNEKGTLSPQQIADEMSQIDSLHNFDKNGNKIPISKKLVQHIMNIGNIKSKKIPMIAKNNNAYDCIHNRFIYASKYLELTDDKASDICFLG